jgi:sterol desaturase/sphingolipid hydroxylase (fatty acid hydroxylase superfamily)
MLKPTTIAIPIFALLIAIEAYFVIKENRQNYNRTDTWINILIGFVSVGFGAIFALLTTQAYFFVSSITPLQVSMNVWWSWVLLLFIDDFAYYWFHRASHEIRFFWNFHVVHHSSDQYNLSVAVRQSWFSGLFHWIFYIPVAFLGFPFWAFVFMHGLNLIYQFWIHTKFIGKMGWFEYIFNTPSHHRVHHGVNSQYLDKNYAGIFIIWDRIFGTFTEEKEEVRYGITTPLKSYNPLWINTHAWFEMFDKMKTRKTVLGKLRCVFASPNMDFEEKSNLKLEPEQLK